MANGKARMACALLVATLFLRTVRGISGAPKLDLHISDKINGSCPWRINLGDGKANIDRCVDKVSITFSDHGPEEETDGNSNGLSSGYESLWGENLYKLHSRPARWHAAKAACEREGAHLVVLDSLEEATAVRALFARPVYENASIVHAGFYTGLTTPLKKSLPFWWHERWVRTNPGARACGRLDGDGFLSLGRCDDEQPFVCEREAPAPASASAPPEATATPPPPSPPSAQWLSELTKYALRKGYEMAPGWNTSYYRWIGPAAFSSTFSWESADYQCRRENKGHLASFESEDEIEAVIQLYQTKNRLSTSGLFHSRSYIGVRTADLVTVQGNLVNGTGYDRWTGPWMDSNCFGVDNKFLLYEYQCSDRSLYHQLCEFDVIPDDDVITDDVITDDYFSYN